MTWSPDRHRPTARSRALEAPNPVAEVLLDGAFAGAVGAAAIALFFLGVDALAAEPLATPSRVGAAIFGGGPGVELALVAGYSALHGLVFFGFGSVVAAVLHALRRLPELPLVALGCFVGLEVGFLWTADLAAPGLAGRIGHAPVAFGNLLAGIAMALYFRFWSHVERSASSRIR